MYRKRIGTTSIIEVTFVVLVASILAVSTLHIKNVAYVSRAQSLIDYIEKQDSMWREIRDMGYGSLTGSENISKLRYNDSCQEVNSDDPTAVILFSTRNNSNNWMYLSWENYSFNCLYSILGVLPREIGIKIGKSLDATTMNEALQNWNTRGIRKKDIWIGESEFSANGLKGFQTHGYPLRSDMRPSQSVNADVMDAYFLDLKMSTDRQRVLIVTDTGVDGDIVGSCEGSCKARTNISGKLIHFIETKGKNSLVSRRYAHCSYNDNGCAIPKSAFTGLTVNTGIGPIENMTGSSCSNRKSTKNECILVTRRMEELAPWEDWNTIDN